MLPSAVYARAPEFRLYGFRVPVAGELLSSSSSINYAGDSMCDISRCGENDSGGESTVLMTRTTTTANILLNPDNIKDDADDPGGW